MEDGQVTSINIAFDSYGWPLSCRASMAVYGSQQATLYLGATDVNDFIPAGTWRLSAVGTGWISVVIGNGSGGFGEPQWFQFTGTDDTPTTFDVTIADGDGLLVPHVNVSLWESSGANYLRDVRFMMPNPAYATDSAPSTTPYAVEQESMWHDTFLAELRGAGSGYAAFRDDGTSSGPTAATFEQWSDLAQCDDNLMPLGSTAYGGQVQIPYKVLLDLVDKLNPAADLYWNVPDGATDAFVSSLGQFLRATRRIGSTSNIPTRFGTPNSRSSPTAPTPRRAIRRREPIPIAVRNIIITASIPAIARSSSTTG